jgi:hypothetical protein
MAMDPHYVPKILSLTLAYTKNGDQQFWKEKFHAANEEAQHALVKDPVFFLGDRGHGIFAFSHVPNVFPSCSQRVPMFP